MGDKGLGQTGLGVGGGCVTVRVRVGDGKLGVRGWDLPRA